MRAPGIKLRLVGLDSCKKSRGCGPSGPGRRERDQFVGIIGSVRMKCVTERIRSSETFTGFNELIKRTRAKRRRRASEIYLSTPDTVEASEQKASRGARMIIVGRKREERGEREK